MGALSRNSTGSRVMMFFTMRSQSATTPPTVPHADSAVLSERCATVPPVTSPEQITHRRGVEGTHQPPLGSAQAGVDSTIVGPAGRSDGPTKHTAQKCEPNASGNPRNSAKSPSPPHKLGIRASAPRCRIRAGAFCLWRCCFAPHSNLTRNLDPSSTLKCVMRWKTIPYLAYKKHRQIPSLTKEGSSHVCCLLPHERPGFHVRRDY